MTAMNAITLRLPEPLQTRLRSVAAANHRSINKQALVLIEQALAVFAPEPPPDDSQVRFTALMRIAKEFRELPVLDARTPDEILGYDEFGLPT